MSRPSERDVRFVAYLERLVEDEDRASLAALRRGLGRPPGSAAEMHRFVVPWIQPDASPWDEAPYYIVAALFAGHQGSWHGAGVDDGSPTNLGASFARLAETVGLERGVEARFVALLNSHRDDLSERLRHVVGLLKAKDIPIDWAQLLHDLKGWTWESRGVQRAWARAFWRSASAADQTPPADQPLRTVSEMAVENA